MFNVSSKIYDLLYSFKDYKQEADQISNELKELMPSCKTILDVACGTGEHHKYLKNDYQVDGLDINEAFINTAKQKNPTGNYFTADMTGFNLNKTYDVILCLFSSIGYAKSLDKVIHTLRCCYRHLSDDGLVMVEPWFTPDNFEEGRVDLLTFEKDDYKICRMNDTSVDGMISKVKFYYLAGKKKEGVTYFEELHELGLYTVEEMKAAFVAANFKVDFNNEGLIGRGLYYGRK